MQSGKREDVGRGSNDRKCIFLEIVGLDASGRQVRQHLAEQTPERDLLVEEGQLDRQHLHLLRVLVLKDQRLEEGLTAVQSQHVCL